MRCWGRGRGGEGWRGKGEGKGRDALIFGLGDRCSIWKIS